MGQEEAGLCWGLLVWRKGGQRAGAFWGAGWLDFLVAKEWEEVLLWKNLNWSLDGPGMLPALEEEDRWGAALWVELRRSKNK